MKLCKDCKHYESPNICYSPSYGIDPVSGMPGYGKAYISRDFGWLSSIILGACGKRARFFEPKDIDLNKPA